MISSVGSAITTLALPLTAVQLLAATPAQMGLLGASDTAAFLVFGLAAGVVADRSRRRTVLLFTSLASSAVVLSVPLAHVVGVLRIEQLYVVAFVAGSLLLLDQVAFQSILPRLVGRDRVLETVTLVRSGDAVTAIVGPSLGGVLVQVLTAPIAIVVDAVSFVVQFLLTLVVRLDEPVAPARAAGTRVWHEVMEGLRYVFSGRRCAASRSVGRRTTSSATAHWWRSTCSTRARRWVSRPSRSGSRSRRVARAR